MTKPKFAFHYFSPRVGMSTEELWVAALDTQKSVTASRMIFRGTLDRCLFHPRDVFRFACLVNAASILVAHNHPSGSCTPSVEDEAITSELVFASRIMQIPLVDHLILGGGTYFSFAEAGLLDESWLRSSANRSSRSPVRGSPDDW